MADATFENKILVAVSGSEQAAAKLRDILTVQREGLRLGDTELKKGRESLAQINLQYRAINALSRSWQAAHPQLALLTRGFSNLATVARSVLSFITSISVAQLAQAQRANQRRETEAEINFLTKQKFDLLSQGFADTHPKVVELNQEIEKLNNRLSEGKGQELADQFTNIATGISGVLLALGAIPNVMVALTAFRLSLVALQLRLTGVSVGTVLFSGALATIPPATVVAGGALRGLGVAFKALFVAMGPIGWAILAITIAMEAYISNFLGFKDAVDSTAVVVKDFLVDLPKHVYIAVIRVVRFFTDMWDKMLDVFTISGKKILDRIFQWKEDIIKYFKDLYNKVIGGSVWPDMLNEMLDISKTKLGDVKSEFVSFKDEIAGVLIGTGDSFMSAVEGGAVSLAGAANSLKASIDQLVSVQQASNALSNIENAISSLRQQQMSIGGGFYGPSEEQIKQSQEIQKAIEEAQKQREQIISFATGAAGITMSQFNALPIGLKEELVGQGIMSQSGKDITGQGLIPGKILQIVTDNVSGGQHTQFSAVRPGRTEAETKFLEETNWMGGRRQTADIPSGPISRNPALIQIINNIGGSVITERELSRKIAEYIARDTQGLIR